jgi:hypothetical protein
LYAFLTGRRYRNVNAVSASSSVDLTLTILPDVLFIVAELIFDKLGSDQLVLS